MGPGTSSRGAILFHDLLRKADRVIVPSSDLGARILRYFPDVATMYLPHPEAYEPMPALHKIVLLGGIAPIKGLKTLEACVKDAAARGLPLHFHVIGHVGLPLATWPAAPLTVGGTFPDGKLAELIALERPDAFLFLSQVPETYSYTLSAAMQTGKPIVATLVGALPERLRTYRTHMLVAPDASAGSINDAIPRRAAPGGAAARHEQRERRLRTMTPEAYRSRLLEPLAKTPAQVQRRRGRNHERHLVPARDSDVAHEP